MAELQRTSIGTTPVFFAEAPPPFVGALVFRVGRADERAATCGITHLVEHLSLPVTGRRALAYNGSVDNIVTSFWATGDADLVLPFLAATADRLRALPLERLETERNVLLAEEAVQGPNPVRLAFALRFGPQEHGLTGYEEYGLLAVDAEQVAEWSETRFTAGNAAVWLTGSPDGLDLALAPGPPRPAPEPSQLAEIEWPAFYAEGPYGVVAFSLLARRSDAFAAAISTLDHRVRERIRYDLGLSYSPTAEFLPLTDELVHVVVVIDTMAANADRVVEETLQVIDVLAANGPNEEELDDERRFAERSLSDPTEIAGHLSYSAAQHLLGAGFLQPAELARSRSALGAEDVAAALREAVGSLLVIAPPETVRPERLAPYPLRSTHAVTGRVHRPRGVGRPGRLPQLVVGPDGVTLRTEPDRHVTALFDSCRLAIRYPDGSRTLLTDDGFFVPIEPEEWRDGRGIVRAVDAAIPEERTVRLDAEATQTADAVEEVAHAWLRRRWLVSDELAALPERLAEDERPLAFLSATKGLRAGLLAVTDRRLLFFARIFGEEWIEWRLDEITSVHGTRGPLGGRRLLVSVGGEDVEFGELKKHDVERFVDLVAPLLGGR